MKLYKIVCGKDVKYEELYKELEFIGNFIIDRFSILFYTENIESKIFNISDVLIVEVDPLSYKTDNKIAEDWIIENYRSFRVEKLLKDAEMEKQEELKKLYDVIIAADEIIERKEDLLGKE